jgi:tellurite resistance protein
MDILMAQLPEITPKRLIAVMGRGNRPALLQSDTRNKTMLNAFVAAGAFVAVTNGIINPEERRSLADLLRHERGIDGFDLREAQARFDLYTDGLFRSRRNLLTVRRAVRRIGSESDCRLRVLRFSLMVGVADGEVTRYELAALRRIGKWLGLAPVFVELELVRADVPWVLLGR